EPVRRVPRAAEPLAETARLTTPLLAPRRAAAQPSPRRDEVRVGSAHVGVEERDDLRGTLRTDEVGTVEQRPCETRIGPERVDPASARGDAAVVVESSERAEGRPGSGERGLG